TSPALAEQADLQAKIDFEIYRHRLLRPNNRTHVAAASAHSHASPQTSGCRAVCGRVLARTCRPVQLAVCVLLGTAGNRAIHGILRARSRGFSHGVVAARTPGLLQSPAGCVPTADGMAAFLG